MADSSKHFPNGAAQHLYLEKLHQEWPEVLDFLHLDVFSRLVALWTKRLTNSTNLVSEQYEQFSLAMQDKGLDRAFKSWAKLFLIKDEWMLATARTTLYMYGANWENAEEEWPGWIQAPPAHLAELVPFEIAISALWIPPEHAGFETWDTFSKRLLSEFKEALNRYRTLQGRRYGALKDNADRDALWTVKYQKGMLAIELAEELPTTYGDPEQTVWKAIDRFAKDIGLTLRQNRPRRTSN